MVRLIINYALVQCVMDNRQIMLCGDVQKEMSNLEVIKSKKLELKDSLVFRFNRIDGLQNKGEVVVSFYNSEGLEDILVLEKGVNEFILKDKYPAISINLIGGFDTLVVLNEEFNEYVFMYKPMHYLYVDSLMFEKKNSQLIRVDNGWVYQRQY